MQNPVRVVILWGACRKMENRRMLKEDTGLNFTSTNSFLAQLECRGRSVGKRHSRFNRTVENLAVFEDVAYQPSR